MVPPTNEQKKDGTLMGGRLLIAVTLVGISVSILGAGIPASGTLRIDNGADIHADAETVGHIAEAFNRAEDAMVTKDLDALMTVYSERYRDQALTKADMRKIWKSFFEQYDQIHTLH
ncbi:MAG: hypothetical protein ABI604_10280, partial [Nitrospirota bacterium]